MSNCKKEDGTMRWEEIISFMKNGGLIQTIRYGCVYFMDNEGEIRRESDGEKAALFEEKRPYISGIKKAYPKLRLRKH